MTRLVRTVRPGGERFRRECIWNGSSKDGSCTCVDRGGTRQVRFT